MLQKQVTNLLIFTLVSPKKFVEPNGSVAGAILLLYLVGYRCQHAYRTYWVKKKVMRFNASNGPDRYTHHFRHNSVPSFNSQYWYTLRRYLRVCCTRRTHECSLLFHAGNEDDAVRGNIQSYRWLSGEVHSNQLAQKSVTLFQDTGIVASLFICEVRSTSETAGETAKREGACTSTFDSSPTTILR